MLKTAHTHQMMGLFWMNLENMGLHLNLWHSRIMGIAVFTAIHHAKLIKSKLMT